MKLKVESVGENINIELTTDTGKKPLKHTFRKTQIPALVALLQTVEKVDSFSVQIEV